MAGQSTEWNFGVGNFFGCIWWKISNGKIKIDLLKKFRSLMHEILD